VKVLLYGLHLDISIVSKTLNTKTLNFGEVTMALTPADPIKILFAIILPPLGVFLEVGFKGHFWLSILLTLLGFVPGIIHALYVIFKH